MELIASSPGQGMLPFHSERAMSIYHNIIYQLFLRKLVEVYLLIVLLQGIPTLRVVSKMEHLTLSYTPAQVHR